MADRPPDGTNELLAPEIARVLDSLPGAIVVRGLDGRVLAWNAVAEQVFGWDRASVIGRQMTGLLVAPPDTDAAAAIVKTAEAGDRWSGRFDVRRVDGAVVRIDAHVAPLLDDEGGVVATVCAAEDVTNLHRAEQRAADLAEQLVLALSAGELGTWRWDMATSLTTWDEQMARLCDVDLDEFDGTFEAWVATLYPGDRERVLEILENALADPGPYEMEHRVVLADGSIRWVLCRGTVTVENGAPTGTIGCASDITERKRAELANVERLEAAEQIANVERLARRQLEWLSRINDAALSSTDHAQLMRRVTRAAVPELGDWCVIYFSGEPNSPLSSAASHVDPDRSTWIDDIVAATSFDLEEQYGVPGVIRSGRPEILLDVGAREEGAARPALASPLFGDVAEHLGITSIVTVPLITKRGSIGAMQFATSSERRLTVDDVALAEGAADQIAAALDNVWLAEQHRMVSRALQEALLPVEIPEIGGLQVAVRYWAAGLVNEVGGDFYDVFETTRGNYSVVIGDVCGTGPQAAAVTAKARHTIRAAATHGAGPADVLGWVNDAILVSHRGRFCTVLYATLERSGDGWDLTTVSSGHPLPVHVRDGIGRLLGTPGTLAGVFPELELHPTTTHLEPGDTLMLFTDGVTDVRPPYGLDDDEVMAMMTAAAIDGTTAEEVIERLGDRLDAVLPFDERNDDMAIIVIRVD